MSLSSDVHRGWLPRLYRSPTSPSRALESSSAYKAPSSPRSPQWHRPMAETADSARVWDTSGSRRNHLTTGRWLTRMMSRLMLFHAYITHCLEVKSLRLIWRSGTRRWNLWVSDLQMSCSDLKTTYQNCSPIHILYSDFENNIFNIITTSHEWQWVNPNSRPLHLLYSELCYIYSFIYIICKWHWMVLNFLIPLLHSDAANQTLLYDFDQGSV